MSLNGLPAYARHTFHYDLRSALLIGVFGGALFPFISIIGRKIGATETEVALLSASPFIANAFTIFFTEDILGKGRLWYVVWPWVIGRAALILMLWVTTPFWYTVVIFAYMTITAVPFPSYASIMKTNYPDDARGVLMSYVRIGATVPWIISSTVAGLVLERSTGFYRYVFPAAAVFGVLSALEFRHIRVKGEGAPEAGLRKALNLKIALRKRPFLRFLLVYTVFEFGVLFALPVYPLVLVDEAAISNTATGVYGAIYTGMWLPGYYVWGRIFDRHSSAVSLAAVSASAIAAPLVYLLSRDVHVLGLAQAAAGFTASAVEVIGYIVFARMGSKEDVPRFVAINIAIGGLRGLAAPLMGVAFKGAYGAAPVFVTSIILIAAAALLSLRLLREGRA